jgi:predicted dehydrogenase/threonine dehydrogenase-like Zn-dependent dehydrogenase
MKQVAQNYKSGELTVLEVPPPACRPGGVVVRTLYSLISVGTEMMKVSEARLSLVGKARARPDQVRKVVDTVTQVGPAAAYKKVMSRLDSYTPLGYSLCGVVAEVGRDAEEFAVGQLVACAGNEHALHAELNWVPTNLCVPVPDGVAPQHAAFATVGAIAMHGVRRAEVQLGDTACVIGLGLVGQLVVRLLVAAGVAVVGLDTVEPRCRLAELAGARACGAPDPEGLDSVERALAALTGGIGADHVFLAAGGSSSGPVHAAARLARDRARIVDIGKCRLDLPWNEYYAKELDIRFSRSYGPGRYDDRYELEGVDYPAGYVRWTERRNLACFLDLVGRGEVKIDALLSEVFPIGEAADVYNRLNAGQLAGVGFLFEYLAPAEARGPAISPPRVATAPAAPTQPTGAVAAVASPVLVRGPRQRLRLGFIGAGNYASSMLLPHLAENEHVELSHVATATSLSTVNAQRKFGFTRASTDVEAVLMDEAIDAVFIVTRHRSHADLTCRALEQGKAVFVEKPLALTDEELVRILDVVDATGNDRLMVGFNRRFAPMLRDLRLRFGRPKGATVARYHVNAGQLPADSWYRNREEGTRFDGEGGHFIDTLSWWLDACPAEVFATRTGDREDVVVSLRFADDSVATITYVTTGHQRYPKETFDASAGGVTARLDNFRRATVWKGRTHRSKRTIGAIDKGQRGEVEAFVESARSGGPMPISLASLVATTKATLAVGRSQTTGRAEPL